MDKITEKRIQNAGKDAAPIADMFAKAVDTYEAPDFLIDKIRHYTGDGAQAGHLLAMPNMMLSFVVARLESLFHIYDTDYVMFLLRNLAYSDMSYDVNQKGITDALIPREADGVSLRCSTQFDQMLRILHAAFVEISAIVVRKRGCLVDLREEALELCELLLTFAASVSNAMKTN